MAANKLFEMPMVDKNVLLSEMEQYMPKQEMMRRVAHQERLLGAARRLQPDLFRERRCHFPAYTDAAAYPSVNVARARQQGLEQRDNQWFCPLCERTLEEYQLDCHMESKSHVKNLDCKLRKDSLERRVRLGELPEWIEVREGMEYCKLCNNYATDAHLETQKHKSRYAWHTEGGVCPEPYSIAPVEEPSEFPVEFGNRDHFEWMPECGAWWCKLCLRGADHQHINSQRHQQRLADPEVFLGTRTEHEPRAVADPIPAWKLLYPGMKESGTLSVPVKPATPAVPSCKPVAARWRKIFIKEEGRSCFQDVETQVVSWQKPDEVYVECF